jgi:hypothetical protein
MVISKAKQLRPVHQRRGYIHQGELFVDNPSAKLGL